MYLSGSVIGMSYLIDNQKTSKAKPYKVGLNVLSISGMRSCKIAKDGITGVNYSPLSVRVVKEDNGRKFYDLHSGTYQVVFEQGIQKLPKDAVASIENSSLSYMAGIQVIMEKLFEFEARSNLVATLIVPANISVSIEIGSNLADLYISYEKFVPEV